MVWVSCITGSLPSQWEVVVLHWTLTNKGSHQKNVAKNFAKNCDDCELGNLKDKKNRPGYPVWFCLLLAAERSSLEKIVAY